MIFEAPVKVQVPSSDFLSWAFGSPVDHEVEPIFIDADQPERKVSRAEAKVLIRQIAAGLDYLGVRRGHCILLHALNDFHTFLLAYGCIAIGAIFSPAPVAAPEHELQFLISTAGADWVFAGSESIEAVTRAAHRAGISQDHIGLFNPQSRRGDCFTGLTYQSLLQHGEKDWISLDDSERASDEIAMRLFTSGSTGPPKAAELSHAYWINICQYRAQGERVKPYSVRMLQQSSLNHVTGWYTAGHVLAGVGVLYVTNSTDVSDHMDLYAKFGITDVIMPPARLAAICRLMEDGTQPKSSIATLKSIITIGAPLPTNLQERIKALKRPHFVRIISGYGSTETGGIIAWPWPKESTTAPITIGLNVPNVDIKLWDSDAQKEIDGPDTPGEFYVRGPALFKGYYQNKEATARAFHVDKDGKWYKTGDVGCFSSSNNAWLILGRLKDNFKLKGEMHVDPTEIEDTLLGHPSIADAAVGPAYTDGMISGIRAWVRSTDEHLTQKDVMSFLLGKIADTKRPHAGVKFVKEIPRNAAGKLLRLQLASL